MYGPLKRWLAILARVYWRTMSLGVLTIVMETVRPLEVDLVRRVEESILLLHGKSTFVRGRRDSPSHIPIAILSLNTYSVPIVFVIVLVL
ncbi:hypothetical protein F5Y13DRAFT_172828 [Hypoxylon sp. FL1857]|nr:hypothetical protein F5Y13DRAFT_172828 [Hypoxylon sp. FL1857]